MMALAFLAGFATCYLATGAFLMWYGRQSNLSAGRGANSLWHDAKLALQWPAAFRADASDDQPDEWQ